MIQLLIADSAPNEQSFGTRFGGRPLVAPRAFEWPHCTDCDLGLPMRFLGQLAFLGDADDPKLALLFMCDHDGCDTWDADSGANRVLTVSDQSLDICEPPVSGALREPIYGARIEPWPGDSYDDARSAWAEANGGQRRRVLGQYGGAPSWLQGDDTPSCACGKTMEFVAQLEEGPDSAAIMNFGGGCAYLFRCGDHAAKLLWQQ